MKGISCEIAVYEAPGTDRYTAAAVTGTQQWSTDLHTSVVVLLYPGDLLKTVVLLSSYPTDLAAREDVTDELYFSQRGLLLASDLLCITGTVSSSMAVDLEYTRFPVRTC